MGWFGSKKNKALAVAQATSPEPPPAASEVYSHEPLTLVIRDRGRAFLVPQVAVELTSNAGVTRVRVKVPPTEVDGLGCVAAEFGRADGLDAGRVEIDGATYDVRWFDVAGTSMKTQGGRQPISGLDVTLVPVGRGRLVELREVYFGVVDGGRFMAALVALRGASRPAREPLTPDALTRLVAKVLDGVVPGLTARVAGRLEVEYRCGASVGRSSLHNLWQAVGPDGRDLADQVRRHASTVAHELLGRVDAETLERAAILPRMRPRHEALELAATCDAVTLPLAGDINVTWVFDQRDAMRTLGLADLGRLRLDISQLAAIAGANLAERVPEIRVHRDNAGRPYMLTCGGNYEASLVLDPTLWPGLAAECRGRLIVSMPTRELCLLADSADPDTIERMVGGGAERFAAGPYPISTQLLAWDDGRWIAHSLD